MLWASSCSDTTTFAAVKAAIDKKDQAQFPIAYKASLESCYSCHKEHTAVDNTFVQLYPTLFEVAQRRGTVKPTYDPTRKP